MEGGYAAPGGEKCPFLDLPFVFFFFLPVIFFLFSLSLSFLFFSLPLSPFFPLLYCSSPLYCLSTTSWLPLLDLERLLFVPPLPLSRPLSPLLSTVCVLTRLARPRYVSSWLYCCSSNGWWCYLVRVKKSQANDPSRCSRSRRPSPTTSPLSSKRSRSSGSTCCWLEPIEDSI